MTLLLMNVNWFHDFSFAFDVEKYWHIFHINNVIRQCVPAKKPIDIVSHRCLKAKISKKDKANV